MKYFKEIFIIFGMYYLGEGMHRLFELSIPGNLLGMLLLCLALQFHIVQVKQIETVSRFFMNHLPFFFLPAGVGIVTAFALIREVWIELLVLCAISSIFTIAICGKVVQYLLEREGTHE